MKDESKDFCQVFCLNSFDLKWAMISKIWRTMGLLYCTTSTQRKSEWRFGALGKYVGLFMGQINTLKKKVKCDHLFGCFVFFFNIVYGTLTQVVLWCMILYLYSYVSLCCSWPVITWGISNTQRSHIRISKWQYVQIR